MFFDGWIYQSLRWLTLHLNSCKHHRQWLSLSILFWPYIHACPVHACLVVALWNSGVLSGFYVYSFVYNHSSPSLVARVNSCEIFVVLQKYQNPDNHITWHWPQSILYIEVLVNHYVKSIFSFLWWCHVDNPKWVSVLLQRMYVL